MGPGVDGRATTCTGPITSSARTTDSRLTNRRIAPPQAPFYNREAAITRVSRATVPEPTTRSQATNADRYTKRRSGREDHLRPSDGYVAQHGAFLVRELSGGRTLGTGRAVS